MEKEDIFNFLIEKSMILDALSTIWKTNSKDKNIIAKKMLDSFSSLDWLLFAYIDFKSSIDSDMSIIQQINNDESILICMGIFQAELLISSKILESNEQIAIIEYVDFKRFVYLKKSDPHFTQTYISPQKNNPIQLLLALSYIKYHIDSLLYLPPEMRQRRLEIIATEYNLSVANLLSLDKQLNEIPNHLNH